MSKPRVVKDYDKLDEELQGQIKLEFPRGFDKHLITFKDRHGKFVSALPYEAEDRYYLVRMTKDEAREIVREDDDYDEDGNLKDKAKELLENALDGEDIDDSEFSDPDSEDSDD